MIVARHLRWSSGRFTFELDAELGAGVTGLFGPSGSGKTTLLELLAGLRRPTGGSLTLGGVLLADATRRLHLPPEQRHLGYVPQDAALFPHLTVAENLRYGAPRAALAGPDAERFSEAHVCEVLGLAGLHAAAVGELSGGERQRVALARALLSHPRLLLLDEPLAGLDAARKATILPVLARLRDEFRLPIVYVSHSPEEIVALCDEVLVFAAGRLVARGAPPALFEPSPEPRYRLRRATPPAP
jgi:molybdate transport system ATP-binding protein